MIRWSGDRSQDGTRQDSINWPNVRRDNKEQKQLDDQELEELQNPENWEEIGGEARPEPSRSRRAVVSVAFPREDFREVAEYAERHGMKTSEFIRKAALAVAGSDPSGGQTQITSISSSLTFVNAYRSTGQSESSARSELREPEPINYSTT